ncbi:hypothetical protein LJ207_01120 [Halanaerobium sp. Z-7514]|uniref:Regulatory protein YycH-like domain-containing protein n=1 Tax=Halanaerobium polyolivorans TaxID=2886943 RepID=A0AAW4WS47_9FIRM|nr:hypothetical protein [Halanaerobium polyolivorans]MCC3143922.1 hypothetical protein [Halanaerobium polyolivorans]RQD78298.1 MAG: hypothetical protein D5S01_01570 [Halanaerobium sp. MSAO_Bac5]
MIKRSRIKLLFVLIIVILAIFFINFVFNQAEEGTKTENKVLEDKLDERGIIKSEVAEKIIEDKARTVINTISLKDFSKLAGYIHPEKGLRFTPYTHVQVAKDIVFRKNQVRDFFEDETKYFWGHYDGTGKDIKLTPAEYYEEFIYSEDFINAEEIGYNEVLSSGNMLENQFEVYEQPIIVEYYFSGFEPKYAGMDWKSLRLVFEKHENSWKLTGIIHNQWTI